MNEENDYGAKLAAVGNDTPVATPERQDVSIEDAIRRIGRKKHIHTFMSAGNTLLGADYDRTELIEKMQKLGVEESGPQAAAIRHTLAIRRYYPSPLFIEAKPARKNR